MQLGDLIESAIWITGDERKSIRDQCEQGVREAIADLCAEEGFEHGPVIFTEKRPGEDRVPAAPAHVQGSRVRLLVGEAKIVWYQLSSSTGFVTNLDKKDLARLRGITRNAWLKSNPGHVLSDVECDDYIEQLGPEAAVNTLRLQ